MSLNESIFPESNYLDSLTDINGIKFTRRELDIIACLLNARRTSKIANLLSISPKTTINHIRNIMLKLECNSQEGIIDFIERSRKISLVRKHYAHLLITSAFAKSLKEISKLNRELKEAYKIIYWSEHKPHTQLVYRLEKDLKSAGFNVSIEARDKFTSLSDLISDPHDQTHYIYVLQNTKLNGTETAYFLKEQAQPLPLQNVNCSLLIFLGEEESEEISQEFSSLPYIYINERDNYFSACFSIIEKLLPHSDCEKIKTAFKEQYETIKVYDSPYIFQSHEEKRNLEKEVLSSKHKFKEMISARKWQWITGFFIIFILSLGSLIFSISGEGKKKQRRQETQLSSTIRSDLAIPTNTALIERPELVNQINEKFASQQGVQAISFVGVVGIGGVGKTTLARQFGRTQKNLPVWELNAETKESLINSFKDLAYALAETKDTKDELTFVQHIPNAKEQEKQIISFVKRHLKAKKDWLLIYDNVETLSEIKEYFPRDAHTWGAGKVLITTRNNNIKNTNYLPADSIINIQELKSSETLALFSKILFNSDPIKLTSEQQDEIQKFLQHIPPFPLDVSMAAYYIKSTKMTFQKYLVRLSQYGHDFEKSQEDLIKEATDYTKTRYAIITSSLEKLITQHPHFQELLVFISLLDSQNIPLSLLITYQKDSSAEQFLHHLRQEGLITSESTSQKSPADFTFSIHRSTQAISRAYLKQRMNEGNIKNLLDKIIVALQTYYKNNSHHYKKIIVFIPHVQAFIKHLDILLPKSALKQSYQQQLLYILGYAHYHSSRHFVSAKKAFSQLKILEDKHPSLPLKERAIMLAHLGDIYSNIYDLDEAIDICQQSNHLCKSLPGTEAIVTENLKTIGYAYFVKNDFEKAKTYLLDALKTASKIPLEKTRYDLEAPIYAHLATLYSARYFNQAKSDLATHYIKTALNNFQASHLFHKNKKHPQEKLSCNIARLKTILGQVYVRFGDYSNALELGFKEAEYIITHSLDTCSHHLLKGRIAEGMGVCALRKGDLDLAERKLTESIHICEKLLGESEYAKIFRAETRIRRFQFAEAYEDCQSVIKYFYSQKSMKDFYSQLLYLTSFYHAALIKYKQGDLKKSAEHFADFFKNMHSLCKHFLDEETYHTLDLKNAFSTPQNPQAPTKALILKYLKQSALIFSKIYDPSHPFLRDYIYVNL